MEVNWFEIYASGLILLCIRRVQRLFDMEVRPTRLKKSSLIETRQKLQICAKTSATWRVSHVSAAKTTFSAVFISASKTDGVPFSIRGCPLDGLTSHYNVIRGYGICVVSFTPKISDMLSSQATVIGFLYMVPFLLVTDMSRNIFARPISIPPISLRFKLLEV